MCQTCFKSTTSVIYPCGDKLNVGISPLSESPVSDVVLDHTCNRMTKNICIQNKNTVEDEGGQTRKHCFLAMFPEGGQTRKH